MRRDGRLACKKRHHPDGLHRSTSSPKRLLSISEGELGSSIESGNNSMIRPECMSYSAHGAMWNSTSASDCSTSMCVSRSTMSMDVVSSKPNCSFPRPQAPLEMESYNTEALKSARGSPFDTSSKDIWVYRSAASKWEGAASDSDCSVVTYPHASVSLREPEGVSLSVKATHVISRREKSSLNSKWGMDEARVKDALGSDGTTREKRLESNSSLHSNSERRGFVYSSLACESGPSYATENSFMEEIRQKQGPSQDHVSVCRESIAASPNVHTRAEGLVGPRAHERSGGLEYFNSRQYFSTEMGLHSSVLSKGTTEQLSPSYVLSSGRLSLEEEARQGRRAPTIDHDFEEYFSSLML